MSDDTWQPHIPKTYGIMRNDGSLEMMSYDEFIVKEDCNATLSAKDCHARFRGAGGVGGALVRRLRNLCIGFEIVDPRRLLPYLVSAQLRYGAVTYWREVAQKEGWDMRLVLGCSSLQAVISIAEANDLTVSDTTKSRFDKLDSEMLKGAGVKRYEHGVILTAV
jgi:hypothetical protein